CKTAQRIVWAAHRFAREFEARHAPGKGREQQFGFEPGQHLADADVNAAAERHMTSGIAANIKLICFFPAPRIPVGGGEEQEDFLFGTNARASDLDLLGGGAKKRLYWRLPTNDLVKCAAKQQGIFAQNLPLLRVRGETVNAIAEPAHGGVEASG